MSQHNFNFLLPSRSFSAEFPRALYFERYIGSDHEVGGISGESGEHHSFFSGFNESMAAT
jgi:hypothetical protein